MDISSPIDFSAPNWQEELKRKTLRAKGQQTKWFIDYFAFSRGFFENDIPPLAVGRIYWDNWVLWRACHSQKPVVNVSPVVMAVHQNHDYRHHPQGREGVYGGEEAARNLELAGGLNHLGTISDAMLVLGPKRLRRSSKYYRHFLVYRVWSPVWFAALGLTRPLRTILGLRSKAVRGTREKI
jgi:hypothetical protein